MNPMDSVIVERAWPYAQLAYNSYHREPGKLFTLGPRFRMIEPQPNDDIGLAYDIVEE